MAKKKEEKEEIQEEKVEKQEEKVEEKRVSIIDSVEFNSYLKSKIDKEVKLEVDREIKKIVRNKNLIIIKRDIIILVLLVCCFFLGYNLYKVSDIRIDITKNDKGSNNSEIKKEKTEEVKDELKEKISKYGKLLDDIFICDDSAYLDDYYKGKLTDELKLYLAYNHMDSEKVMVDGKIVYVNSEDLKNSFEDILDGEYKAESFKWGSDSFKYLSSKDIYLYSGDHLEEKCNIKRDIIDIDDSDNLVIEVVEGKIKDGKLYNIISNTEVKDYKDKKIDEYKDLLTTVSYHFKKDNDKFKLFKIEV